VNFQYNNIFDVTEAKRDLGFRTTIPFADGASRVYQTLLAQNKITDSDSDPLDDRIMEAWTRHSEALISELGKVE
jgi:hypothetical protein